MAKSTETRPVAGLDATVESEVQEPLSGSELLVTPDDDQAPVVSVVMPTMNEERGIGACIQSVKNALEELQVYGEVVVSDSSSDQTPEIARSEGARVITPDQGGYGYAYQYAFEHVRGQYVVMGDADTTYDFREIPRLLSCITDGDADIVMGDRLGGNIKDGAMPALHQYVGNPALTWFLNLFYDASVSDAHSGLRVFRKDVL
ncbi:MAG: glycosyltransferase family 2 protein, partial [Halobacteriaceae archaeon]